MTTMSAENFKLTSESKFGTVALGVGVAGVVASVAGLFIDHKTFFFAYLVAFMFWMAIALGGLFFTMVHHLVGAEWSIVLRRIPETLASAIPMMAILFIPIVLGMHNLYEWSHAEVVASDPILQHKSAWLNPTAFTIRAYIYFGLWTLIAWTLYKASLEQDGGKDVTEKMRGVSAPSMIVFALSITAAAFDWLMSLDPHWFSTIFGVYFFAGSWWTTLAFVVLFSMYLRSKSKLGEVMTIEHYHDLGKLMFGFTVFWTYIAFSQFMLIWYGNIPEETIWYKHRWEHGWEYVSLFLVIGHFILPFLVLIFRASKRNFTVMKIAASWFLLMEFVDLYWLIMPTFNIVNPDAHHGLHFSWQHLATFLGVGGVFLWFVWNRLTSASIVPVGDPRIEASIHLKNA
jgi:hypothetical protein